MKKYEQYMKWIMWFVLGIALIAVYKTFDNLQNIFSFFGEIISALAPFVIGAVIAYILNIPCRKLEVLYAKSKYKIISKNNIILSIISVYVIFILLISFLIRMVIPTLFNNIVDLYNNILPFTQNAILKIEQLQQSLGISFIEIDEDTARTAIQKILNSINISDLSKYTKGAISFTNGLLNIFIAFIVSVYMLIDRERIYHGYHRIISVIIPNDKIGKVNDYTKKINSIFSNYIYSCVLDAFIVATLATVILTIIGVKYSVFFGFFIGICNLIPYFGSIISNIITVLFIILSGDWGKAIWAIISLFILGQLDGNIIGPKIMGSKLDARPLWIIFAVTLGSGLFGIPGMLLSVPIMMVVKMILGEIITSLEYKKKASDNNIEE